MSRPLPRSFVPLALLLGGCSKAPASSAPPSDAGAPDVTEADAGGCTSPAFTGSPFGIQCKWLVDSQGRTAFLHGVNARVNGVFDTSHADGRPPNEIDPDFTSDDAAQIRSLGYNALRLPIQWSAIEPTEMGGFDDAYLDRVAAVTALCAAAGVFVLLDLHEDQYSKEIGEDGAPLWAISPAPTVLMGSTLPDGAPNPPPAEEYTAAFNTFFGSSQEGTYLRDRYTAMAVHVAARFAADPAVLGLELMNEPFGSDVAIHPLYQEMIPAVRAAAPSKLIFWEPTGLRNELDQADHGDGTSLGAGTIYAPHVYTYVFVPNPDFTKALLEPSNLNARAEADSWGAPLVITEWGFDPHNARYDDYVRFQQELQDEVLASNFMWLWKEPNSGTWGLFDFTQDASAAGTLRVPTAQALARPRLEAVAGTLQSAAYDADARTFTAHFTGSAAVTAPNVLSLGSQLVPPAASWKVTCDGAPVPNSGADPLLVPCNGDGPHVLALSL